MNDKKINKNLKIFSIVIIFLTTLFLISGIVLSVMLKKVQEEEVNYYLVNQTTLYETYIDRQFSADMQTLKTLESFIDFDSDEVSDELLQGLDDSNENNKFIRMSLVYKNGDVYHATLSKGIKKENASDLNSKLQKIIKQSWNGEDCVSDIFYDEYLGKSVIVISTPIVENDKVVGVILAYDDVNEIRTILETNKTKDSYIHIIDDKGNFLIRTDNRISNEQADSIYGMSVSFLDEHLVRNALENRESYFDIFDANGETYCVYFSPMKYSDWYIFSIIPYHSIETVGVDLLDYSTLIYALMIIVVIAFVAYAFNAFKNSRNMLESIAYKDELTGIDNIHKFELIISELAEKRNDDLFSMVAFNIKNFQFINETFGEDRADNLLKFIAETISSSIYEGEYCCREIADRFFILLKYESDEVTKNRIEDISTRIKEYFVNNGNNYNLRLSIGISTGNIDERHLLNNALWAMKEAKKNNENYVFFNKNLLSTVKLQREIESNMYQALKDGEFKLYLQPKFDIYTNKACGAEALVRWIQDDGKCYFPDQFIPIFEHNGFCVELDLYMVEQVCRQLKEWKDEGYEIYPVSVNQTKLLFYKVDYVEKLCEITKKYGISPEYIILEILEGLDVEDVDAFNNCVNELHNCGFKVSMDDFGSGYSSLGSLQDLKVDEIKIDRKFLELLDDENVDDKKCLFERIIALVKALDKNIVMEGVETEEHVKILKELECKYAQGYYYSRPISAEDYKKFL